ncbi:hypothetical protein D3C72_2081710 [compost metagenome]
MHAPAQFQAHFTAPRHGVGAHQQLLARGDARIGAAQVGRADAATVEQRRSVYVVILEGL